MHCSIFKILVSVVRSVPSSDSFIIISCNKSFVNTFLKIFLYYFFDSHGTGNFSIIFFYKSLFSGFFLFSLDFSAQ